jgi:glycosyltransferase involved in cell wall biosynthesis
MRPPLVSVVIPAYNAGRTVERAVASALGQTYGSIEVIVVNDGSRDDTEEKVARYADRIVYVSQKNGGVSKARNTGIEMARGDYIALLDADDVWRERKIEIQMRGFRESPEVGLVFSDFSATRSGRARKESYFREAFPFFKEYGYDLERIFPHRACWNENGRAVAYYWGNIFKFLFLGNFILPSSVLMRKESLRPVGLFDESYSVAEETEFFLRFSRKYAMGFVDFPLLDYSLPSQDNLSGKGNLVRLIQGALRAQTEILENAPGDVEGDAHWFRRGVGGTYARLAYYYLTEGASGEARRSALAGLRACRRHPRNYLLLLAGLLPRPALRALASLKGRAAGRRAGGTP